MLRTITGTTVVAAGSMLRNPLALCALGATFSPTGCVSPDRVSTNPAGAPDGADLQAMATQRFPGR